MKIFLSIQISTNIYSGNSYISALQKKDVKILKVTQFGGHSASLIFSNGQPLRRFSTHTFLTRAEAPDPLDPEIFNLLDLKNRIPNTVKECTAEVPVFLNGMSRLVSRASESPPDCDSGSSGLLSFLELVGLFLGLASTDSTTGMFSLESCSFSFAAFLN